MNEARKDYEDSNHREAEADAYAKALLNRARLWIEDRVATEGADLKVAVGLLSELVRVRKVMLDKVPWDEKRREGFVRAQIEQARLLSLIRTSPMLEQAEMGLTEALQWIPLEKSEEVAGENAARGLYASYSASNLRLPEGRPFADTDPKPSVAPKGSVHVHRVPSWSAQSHVLTQLADAKSPVRLAGAMPPVWLADAVRNGDGLLWHPDARQIARSWRLFGNAKECKSAKPLRYLGGGVVEESIGQYAHALFFLDSDGAILVLRPSEGAQCERLKSTLFGPPLPAANPSVTDDSAPNEPVTDNPVVTAPEPDDPLTVDGAARLIYAKKESVFWVDAVTDTGKKPTIRESLPFQGTVKRIVASTDDESVGFVIRNDATISTLVMSTVHDAADEEKERPLFHHPVGKPEDGMIALSSALAFVRNGRSLDVFSRKKLTRNENKPLSEFQPVLSIDIGDTSNANLFVHTLGDDFAVLQLRGQGGEHYGAHVARLHVRVGHFRYSTELGPRDAMGFKRGVLLSFEDEKRDRFTVRVLAAGVNGVLHRTTLDKGLRINSTEAQGLTSERAVVLNSTAMLLSTRIAAVGKSPVHRNVPSFNGHEIDAISQFCTNHSDWGCRVAPISVSVPEEATGSRSGCGLDSVSDPILLVAVGRDGGGERPVSSDVVARAKVGCDARGRPVLVGMVERLHKEFPEIVELEAEAGQEYDGPVWRHVGPAGLVLPAGTVFAFAALPHEKLDPDDVDFVKRAVLRVPVRLVRETNTLVGTVALRSPYGVRHLLVRTNASGGAVENALVVADHPDHVVTYTGAAETPVPFAELLPRRMVQVQFGEDGNALLLGKIDVDEENGQLVRIERAAQGSGFTFGAPQEMNALPLMNQWMPRERAAGYMRFEFFGATPNLEVVWRPDGLCTVVERADDDTIGGALRFGVGRPAGISHLLSKTGPTSIVIQGGRLVGKPKPGLRRGLPFTQFWGDLNAGARGACKL